MSIVRYIEKLRLLDSLIKRKATGNQKEFCKKTGMSRSVLNIYINEMKQLGFPIYYDRKRNTYYYKEEGRLVKKLFERQMPEQEMKKYNGGRGIPVIDILTILDNSQVHI